MLLVGLYLLALLWPAGSTGSVISWADLHAINFLILSSRICNQLGFSFVGFICINEYRRALVECWTNLWSCVMRNNKAEWREALKAF